MNKQIISSTLFLALGLLLIYLSNSSVIKTNSSVNNPAISYYVSGCQNTKTYVPTTVHFENNTLIIKHSVSYVCCAKIVPKVKITNDIINITEINEGDVCKCMCNYIIQINISGLEKKPYEINVFGVKYKDIHPAEKILSMNITLGPMESTKDNFCGISTHGKCSSDKDCIVGGCSNQVCQSIFEKPTITTCEWRECYNADFYGYKCGCINGRCEWHK